MDSPYDAEGVFQRPVSRRFSSKLTVMERQNPISVDAP
jgi:hypothetical protein